MSSVVSKVASESLMTITGFNSQALGALATRDLVLNDAQIATQLVGGTYISSKTIWMIKDPDAADGPYLCGVATGALTATQIEDYLEMDGPTGPTHSGVTEISERGRHIRILGILNAPAFQNNGVFISMFDQVVKMGWAEQDGGWNYWLYNLGDSILTGSTWEVHEVTFVKYDRD